MTGRLKKFIFVTVTAVVIAFLLGPPLAIASNLPTVCNIFNKKQIEKSGPCKNHVTFSKDKYYEGGLAILIVVTDLGISNPTMVHNNHHSLLHPPGIILSTAPLRC